MDFLKALAPSEHAVVHAAAGTGKTWLLTSRIVRMLLAGIDSGSILAITFTRKAALEMHHRLHERLYAMAAADDAALDTLLLEIGVTATPELRTAARGLYESWLSALHPVRTTTFHAFCQELLQRFPLEAGVPPVFELSEHTAELEIAAWQALDRELTRNSRSAVAQAMEILLRRTGSLYATRSALAAFLRHRSDWWTYTEDASDPVDDAIRRLPAAFDVASDADPVGALLASPDLRADVEAYAELLRRHTNAVHAGWCAQIESALAAGTPAATAFISLSNVLFTAEGHVRSLKGAKTLNEKLGAAGFARLQALQYRLAQRLGATEDRRRRIATMQLSAAWYRCGQRLLEHFQRLKREQNLLDFADLEWHTYRLLTRGQHAEWVQYKLDRQILHLLVDEFQDTNPTQWRLLLPLLVEMAAGEPDTPRSVFLVGDDKQSIYRFRRADPRLFDAAREWLTQNARASTYTQHVSWRSSPAIIHFVNLIFQQPHLPAAEAGLASPGFALNSFQVHGFKHAGLWGVAQLLPLVPREPPASSSVQSLRDPLAQPRLVEEDVRHRREGDMIAQRIESLVGSIIATGPAARPLGYGDIMILLRDRTHAAAYEAALRHARIPYVGAERGAFTRCLEIRDLVQLLSILTSAGDDVALASVLRSPMFTASDSDLAALATIDPETSWYERLLRVTDQRPTSALGRAQRLIPAWKALADRIPAHDLLDRIYCDGDIVARYESAAPPHLKDRVAANLHRLLVLALEVDSGRFPSLTRFLARLHALTADDSDAAGSVTEAAGDAVRIMTIHAAKGLESPVVFLANAAHSAVGGRDRGMRALIEWPVEESRPRYFHLVGKKQTLDDISRAALERHEAAARREEANLLYVALTRAKQVLYVSGCEPARGNGDDEHATRRARGWYGFIEARLEKAGTGDAPRDVGVRVVRVPDSNGNSIYNVYGGIEYGQPTRMASVPAVAAVPQPIDPALTRPLDDPRDARHVLSPSRDEASRDDDRVPSSVPVGLLTGAKRRGVVIHRMLELLAGADDSRHRRALRADIEQEWRARLPAAVIDDCWHEACAVIDDVALRRYFDRSTYREARNEVAILYRQNDREIYGIIDRVIIRDNEIVIVDYKTHRVNPSEQHALTLHFSQQLRWYAGAVQRLWPGMPVRALLLFTANREVVEVDLTDM